jgi:hypothetical protein
VPYSAERITADRLEDQSRVWDRAPAYGATLDDLDLDLIQSIASQIAYGISVEKCLQYLDLAEFTPEVSGSNELQSCSLRKMRDAGMQAASFE